MFGFTRKDPTFFTMFSDIAKNLIDGALTLVELFDNYGTREEKRAEIKRIEHVGDNLTHSVLTKLNQTFITPFDREDIHYLASALDDIADYIYAAAKKINFYRVNPNETGIKKMADLIAIGCVQVHRA
ncbi:MAG TPA: DUF47 family protein, partial [Terriglobales bacterium]